MHSAKAIANYFLEKGKKEGTKLSPLKLIKLVYIAHGWHLGFAEEPLIEDYVHAWKFGPVIPDLYHEFKHFGDQPIDEPAQEIRKTETGYTLITPDIDDTPSNSNFPLKHFLDEVWDVYKHYDAYQLSNLTHQPDTPWAEAMQASHKKDPVIDDDKIQEYYAERIQNSK